MPITLRRVATNGDTSASFASTDAFDTAVIVILAVAASADFGDLVTDSSQVTDDHNNVYSLLYSQVNVVDSVNGNFLAVAVYAAPNLQASPTPVVFNIPGDLTPGDVVTSMVFGMEFDSTFNQYSLDKVVTVVDELVNFSINAGTVPAGADDLCLCFALDGALGNTGDMTFGGGFNPAEEIDTTLGPTDGASSILAFKEASTALGTQNLSSPITVGTANGVFAWMMGLRMTTLQGTGKQLTFQISKGPDPKILPEGRAIATVIIDGSQQNFQSIITPPGLNFPEFSFFGQNVSDSWETYWQTEFDLESVGPQGSRLTELRGLIARSRPFFGLDPNNNRSDNPGFNGTAGRYAVAFLTNLTTLQTVVLGGHALFDNDSLDTGMAMSETIHRAIPANAGGMKFRFLVVCNNTRPDGYGIGKWILNFTNFELPSDSVVSEAIGVGRYD